MVVVIRKCSCCGREFATGVFGFRCDYCQDSFAWTSNGIIGKAHPPCRPTIPRAVEDDPDPQARALTSDSPIHKS